MNRRRAKTTDMNCARTATKCSYYEAHVRTGTVLYKRA